MNRSSLQDRKQKHQAEVFGATRPIVNQRLFDSSDQVPHLIFARVGSVAKSAGS
jgi:hypothetical protein